MIEFNGNVHKCLDCGAIWKSNAHTKKCNYCGIPADRFRRHKKYTKDCVNVTVTPQLKERLLRRRTSPSEGFASVVDRLVNNPIDMKVNYPRKKVTKSVAVTIEAHNKLKQLKAQYKLSTMNEVIWRQLDG